MLTSSPFSPSLLLLFWLLYGVGSGAGNPCWCQPLREYIHSSIELLEKRYSRQLLHSSTVFTSSGYDHGLERRLLDVLNDGRQALKLGILGGSYSLPVHPHANAWSYNITRWLNAALSSGTCTLSELIPVTVHGACNKVWCSPQDPYCAEYYEGCTTLASSYMEPGAVFCHPNVSSGDEEEQQRQANYHSKAQPLDDICDNTVLPKRPCTIFGGSGKYATLNMASKGGTVTLDGVRSIATVSDEPLDILIWDYGTNDVASGMDIYHNPIVQSFFQQVIRKYPTINTVAMVYWQDDTDDMAEQCKSNGHTTWSNDLCTADFPFIKRTFDPIKGSLRNISFISTSLPQFCRAANCTLNDILQANSGHPKDSGISLFSDLFIWQLLHYFKKLLSNQCNKDMRDEMHIHNTNYTTEEGKNVWVVDAHIPLLPYSSKFKGDIQKFSEQLPHLLSNPSKSYTTVATLIMYSPQIASPLPVNQFAYLCTPGKVFEPFASAKAQPVWTPVNVVSIMKAGCAGWMNSGFRDEMRADDNHMYIPASTTSCPAAGWPANKVTLQALTHSQEPIIDCPSPQWPNNHSYPHAPWENVDTVPPLIKPVDILLRVTTSLEWHFLCYDYLACIPRILWRARTSGLWQNASLDHKNDQFDMTCYEKSQEVKMDKVTGGYIYLLLPADQCLPWHVFEGGKWRPTKLESTITLIKSSDV